jgi:hypothetical protein
MARPQCLMLYMHFVISCWRLLSLDGKVEGGRGGALFYLGWHFSLGANYNVLHMFS